MTNEQIDKMIHRHSIPVFKINFRGRTAVNGLFIKTNDYNELKAKNFWRIVPQSNISEYEQTKNAGLARVFSGDSFTSLTDI